jgi:hypothetical protein
MLAALESAPERLSVLELSLSRQDVGATPSTAELLRADLVVEGIGRNSVASPGKGKP